MLSFLFLFLIKTIFIYWFISLETHTLCFSFVTDGHVLLLLFCFCNAENHKLDLFPPAVCLCDRSRKITYRSISYAH